MTNKEVAAFFNELADVMELHKDNPFKIRSYRSTYIQLRKLGEPLTGMERDEIAALKGVGKATTDKILEILRTGGLETLRKHQSKTPDGVLEMLKIKGFGPSKVRVVWKELGCTTVGELLYACNENRLVTLKGFGAKTQQDLINKIHFFFKSKDKFHYARIIHAAEEALAEVKRVFPNTEAALVGQIRRQCPIVDGIDILLAAEDATPLFEGEWSLISQDDKGYSAKTADDFPLRIFTCALADFGSKLFKYTGARDFMQAFLAEAKAKDFKGIADEKEVFAKAGLPYVLPELRENGDFIKKDTSQLITDADVDGVIHAHSTYSDGTNSLREMADYAKSLGYTYLGITDHSQSAFYANGLKEARVREQWAEIDVLNAEFAPFRIYKGIESDILYDGSLDYPDELLAGFDFIIASVHSTLRMDVEKATSRLITAVENPHTTILGHPTGRLLLSRAGYPIDHKKVIDACAANDVVIEMNANPLRLDMDYRWIPYAMDKNVKISINPDAHSTRGIHDIKYGALAARKGGLTKAHLFSLKGFLENR